MKHTFKICAILLLALVLALSICLIGCGEENPDKDKQATETAADRGDTVATGTAPDGTTWTVYESGELAITGTPADGTMYDYNKNIATPAWKAYAADITGLTLDDSIEVIAADAFSSMKNLIWVKFGSGTLELGDNAFRSCSNLRRVILPDGVTTIGKNTFDGCYRLYEVVMPETLNKIGASAFVGCSNLLTVTFPAGEITVNANAFPDAYKLVEVITDNASVTAGANTFGGVARYATTAGVHGKDEESILSKDENGFIMNGNRLVGYVGNETAIEIPEGIIGIADYAFFANTAITSVDVGDEVKSIGKNAFGSCTNLETLTIGTAVNTINAGAFNGCSGLETLNFNAAKYPAATAVDGMFENCTALTNIVFGSNYATTTGAALPTGAGMFRGCTALKSVTLPPVATIPEGMFEGCTGLETVTFNAKNKTISDSAFKNCTALVNLDLTQLAKSATLQTFAFEGCSSLVTIDLTNVSSIKEGTFNYCKSLTGVVIGGTFSTTSGKQSFDGCTKLVDVVNNSNRKVSAGDTSNGGVAKYTTFEVGEGESRLKKVNGYLFLEMSDANYLVGYVGTDTALVLPASYSSKNYSVYNNAFSNNKKIQSVKIGAGVVAIGEAAFRNCTRLVNVDLTGSTVTSIPQYTFDGCSALEVITLTNGITAIGEAAFRNTAALGVVDLKNVATLGVRAFQYSGATKITASAVLTLIPEDAFSGCARLTQVTLPGAVTIKEQAFANCVSLVSLSIPKAETICKYAFYHNTALATVALPAGKVIEQGAFQECGGLTALSLGANVDTIGEAAFKDCGKLVYIMNSSSLSLTAGELGLGHVTRYAEIVASAENDILKTTTDGYVYMVDGDRAYLLAYTGTETTLTLPATLGGKAYDIFRFAFWNSPVKNVTVPEGVKVIGTSAFAYSAIENIILPASLREIQDSAFEGSKLQTISLKEGITKIGNACFKNCSDLQKFAMPNSVTTLGMSAFRECVGLREFTLGTGLTKMPAFALDGCVSLAQLIITPDNLTYGTRWYWGCDKLLEIWIKPDKTNNLGKGLTLHDRDTVIAVTTGSTSRIRKDENGFVFFYNSGLGDCYLVGYEGTEKDLILPDKAPNNGTYQIFNYAFYNRDDIETVRFSDRITGVGRYAFAACDNLKGVYLPTTLTGTFGVGENLFWDCDKELVVATGFAGVDTLPETWSEDFNAQGPASAYGVIYGVTYDLFLTMLK